MSGEYMELEGDFRTITAPDGSVGVTNVPDDEPMQYVTWGAYEATQKQLAAMTAERDEFQEQFRWLKNHVASVYVLPIDDRLYPSGVTVVFTGNPDPRYTWAIRKSERTCMDKDGDWIFEPMPSSRDDEFYAMCRWPTMEDAIAFAKEHVAGGAR